MVGSRRITQRIPATSRRGTPPALVMPSSTSSRALRVRIIRCSGPYWFGYFHALGDIAGHDDPAGGGASRAVSARRECGRLALNGFKRRGWPSRYPASAGSPANPGRAPARQSRSEATKSGVCAAVGDHQHFRRPGGHVDSRAVQTLAHLTRLR